MWSFYIIVLVKDHDSICKVPMDDNGFVLADFLKRYILEHFLLDDEVQLSVSCWNVGRERSHHTPSLVDLDFLNDELSTMTG